MKNFISTQWTGRIVRALQRDASLSHAALAETVGASAASVWRRVRNLETGGRARPPRSASPIPARLGRSVNVLCQVRMHRQTVDARAEFEAFIRRARRSSNATPCRASGIICCASPSRDVADYDRFIRQGVLAHPSVANAASNFALRQVKYTTEIPV